MQSNYKEQNYGNSSIEIKLLKLLKNVSDLFNYENNSHELDLLRYSENNEFYNILTVYKYNT